MLRREFTPADTRFFLSLSLWLLSLRPVSFNYGTSVGFFFQVAVMAFSFVLGIFAKIDCGHEGLMCTLMSVDRVCTMLTFIQMSLKDENL